MTTTFLDLCKARFSCRSYCPEPVPRETIQAVLEAARLAPSACNRQPWRFAVASTPEKRRALFERGVLPGLGMSWILQAPVLIALGMEKSLITHVAAPLLSRVAYPWIDIGIAGEHLALAAADLGLGTCWIGWIRPRGVRRVVGWPLSIRPCALFTLGRPAAAPDARSQRRPLADIAKWLD